MTPPVPDSGAPGEPEWPPRDAPTGDDDRAADGSRAASQQPAPPRETGQNPPVWAPEQPTAQLPRRPDAGRFPYPAPDFAAPPPPAADRYRYPAAAAPPTGDQYRYPEAQRPAADQYRTPAEPTDADDDQQQTDPTFDPRGYEQPRHQPPPRGSHLPPYSEPFGSAAAAAAAAAAANANAGVPGGRPTGDPGGPAGPPTAPRTGPRKLTVTRVAAFRSRELTTRGVQIFQRAATADGADRSGLTALTYAVMGNYAVDAALAVALANTLFFAAATAESTSKVLLYLLITVAPFAVIAPLIGPALDKLQRGRRIALAASSFARAVLAVIMALNFDSWVLYPCALGMLVLSKSFSLLKAAITPRVLPPELSLVKSNSRLTVFGLLAGGVAGALAAGFSWAFGSTGALVLTALLSIVGGWLCLRIPAWVESTAGEIPVDGVGPKAKRGFPLSVTTTMWANGTIRIETGFLALFIAFVIKSEYSDSSGFTQLLLLGVVGLAAGLGGFIGNGLGAKLPLSKPETVSILSLAATAVATLIAVLVPGLPTAAIVGLVGSTASSLAKVCLDSVIQHELPEASRASAFGLSETVLQLSWVFGGVVGLLIGGVWSFGHDSVYSIGFAVITVFLVIGLAQSWLVSSGRSLFPWLDYSKLTRHLRRSTKDGAPRTTRVRMGQSSRDAGQPPAPTWAPGGPTAGPPIAQPPIAQPPTGQAPWQGGPAGQPWQATGPAPGQQAWSNAPPNDWRPPATPPPGYPPATQQGPATAHPPARDAGARRKWTKRP